MPERLGCWSHPCPTFFAKGHSCWVSLLVLFVLSSKDILTKCLGDLVVETILAPPSVLKGSLVECPCCFSLCQFPKTSFKKCLGDLAVEAMHAPPSVLKSSLVECPYWSSLCNFQRNPLKSALETWLLKPSMPHLLCFPCWIALVVIFVQISKDILQKMLWRLGCWSHPCPTFCV